MLSKDSETPSTAPQLTTGEREIVNWFFMRLQTNYGTKFWTQFSDEKTLLLTKREWAENILRYSKEELHHAIEFSKSERERGNDDFEWPDIAKILGSLKHRISPDGNNSSAYIDFKDPKHPSYEAPRIESDESKSRLRAAKEKAMRDINL